MNGLARLADGSIVELGRRVTLDDVKRQHPGKPERCLCRGSGQIVVHGAGPGARGRSTVTICALALNAFNAECGPRVVTVPSGEPFWMRGRAPEDWGFVEMFATSMREFAWREAFRKKCGFSQAA